MLVVPKSLFQVQSQGQLGENLVYLLGVGVLRVTSPEHARTCFRNDSKGLFRLIIRQGNEIEGWLQDVEVYVVNDSIKRNYKICSENITV